MTSIRCMNDKYTLHEWQVYAGLTPFIYCLQGVSSWWWNYRHFQHHAKPNVVSYNYPCHSVNPPPRAPHTLHTLFLFCSTWRTQTLLLPTCSCSERSSLKSGVDGVWGSCHTEFNTSTSFFVRCIILLPIFQLFTPTVGPPLLLPIYFHLEVLFYTFKRKLVKVCNLPQFLLHVS